MTKMMKPLQALINKRGIRHSIYIDDGRVVAETKEKTQEDYKQVLSILAAAGWQIAPNKSDKLAEVSQKKHFLGFCINSEDMTVALSEEKKEQIKQVARQVEVSAERYLLTKDLASLIGKVAAAEPALGAIVPIMTRRAYQDIDEAVNKSGWSGKIKISTEVAEDFRRFRQRVDEFDGSPIRTQATEIAVVSIIGEPSEFIKQKFIQNHRQQKEIEIWAGDASATAVCAFSVTGEQSFFFRRKLTSEEQKTASGMRELLTVKYALQDMEEEIGSQGKSKTVYWLTDSENLVRFLTKGSGRRPIQEEVLKVIEAARRLKISLVPIHLRREDPRIKIADAGSKSADSDDWSIDNESFKRLERRFGKFTVDLFANEANHKVDKFYSAYYSPGPML